MGRGRKGYHPPGEGGEGEKWGIIYPGRGGEGKKYHPPGEGGEGKQVGVIHPGEGGGRGYYPAGAGRRGE